MPWYSGSQSKFHLPAGRQHFYALFYTGFGLVCCLLSLGGLSLSGSTIVGFGSTCLEGRSKMFHLASFIHQWSPFIFTICVHSVFFECCKHPIFLHLLPYLACLFFFFLLRVPCRASIFPRWYKIISHNMLLNLSHTFQGGLTSASLWFTKKTELEASHQPICSQSVCLCPTIPMESTLYFS